MVISQTQQTRQLEKLGDPKFFSHYMSTPSIIPSRKKWVLLSPVKMRWTAALSQTRTSYCCPLLRGLLKRGQRWPPSHKMRQTQQATSTASSRLTNKILSLGSHQVSQVWEKTRSDTQDFSPLVPPKFLSLGKESRQTKVSQEPHPSLFPFEFTWTLGESDLPRVITHETLSGKVFNFKNQSKFKI